MRDGHRKQMQVNGINEQRTDRIAVAIQTQKNSLDYSVPTPVCTPGSLYTPIEKLPQFLFNQPVDFFLVKYTSYLYSG